MLALVEVTTCEMEETVTSVPGAVLIIYHTALSHWSLYLSWLTYTMQQFHPKPVLMHGVVPPQVQDPALALVEPHQIPMPVLNLIRFHQVFILKTKNVFIYGYETGNITAI